jgi:hypothetical protein
MPAFVEQEIVAGVTLPVVPQGTQPSFIIKDLNTIEALVIVSQSETGLSVAGPAITIPGPGQQSPWQWTVLWSFMADTGDLSVSSIDVKVQMPNNPEVVLGQVTSGPDLHQRQIAINLDSIKSADQFNYTVSAEPGGHHDPTIVVTQEPIG